MAPISKSTRAKIIAARKRGASLNEIVATFGCAKSTASLLCRGVEMTKAGKATHATKRAPLPTAEQRKKGREKWLAMSAERRDCVALARASLAATGTITTDIEERLAALPAKVASVARAVAQKAHEQSLQPRAPRKKLSPEQVQKSATVLHQNRMRYSEYAEKVKDIIEKHLGTTGLRKEVIDEVAILPYCNDEYVIGFSHNRPMAKHVVRQFAVVSSTEDTRKRIAFVPLREQHVDYRRLTGRLQVEVVHLDDLWATPDESP